jgi:hypothetical protein
MQDTRIQIVLRYNTNNYLGSTSLQFVRTACATSLQKASMAKPAMQAAPTEPTRPGDTVKPAPFRWLESAACGFVPVVPFPCVPGPGGLAEDGGGAPAGADGGVDGGVAAGGDDDEAGGGVVGAGAAGGGDAGVVGGVGAGDDGGGALGLAGGGDEGGGAVVGAGGGEEAGGVVDGAGAPPVPLRPAASTMTMSFSLARQLASTPLMKKKAPEWSSVNVVSPSVNFFTYDDVLHAL